MNWKENIRALAALALLVAIGSCSPDDNEITEVGNPTSTATTNGTVSALGSGVDGLLTGQADAALSRNGIGRLQTEMGDFSCSQDQDDNRTTCTCPVGGSMVHTLTDGDPEMTGGVVTFSNEVEITFNDCTLLTCDESVVLSGTAEGSISGTFSAMAGDTETTTTIGTTESCSGMTAGDQTYGFSMTIVTSGISSHEFSGEFCITDPVSFDSLDELQTAFDPEGTCSDSN